MRTTVKRLRHLVNEAILTNEDEIEHMQKQAKLEAEKLERAAKGVRKAASTIARIAKNDKRSTEKDGPKWDDAEETLQQVGVKVPNSAYFNWEK